MLIMCGVDQWDKIVRDITVGAGDEVAYDAAMNVATLWIAIGMSTDIAPDEAWSRMS